MNKISDPDFVDAKRVKKAQPFQIPLRFSAEELEVIEPLWSMEFAHECKTATMGRVTFTLETKPDENDYKLFLKIEIGKHAYCVHVSSDLWLEQLQAAFEEGFVIADHPKIAALALEGEFADAIIAVEAIFDQEFKCLELSASQPEKSADDIPGTTFTVEPVDVEPFQISIVPATPEAGKAMIAMIAKGAKSEKQASTSYREVEVSASLVADVTEIPGEHLRGITVGDGFMLNANWADQASYNLVVKDKALATLARAEDNFTIDELFIKTSPPPSAKKRPVRTRRSRRLKQESAAQND